MKRETFRDEEDLIDYWVLQSYLDYCHQKCEFKSSCVVWSQDGASYNERLVHTCPNVKIRKVFWELARLKRNKPPGYFYVTIRELCEIESEVRRRLKKDKKGGTLSSEMSTAQAGDRFRRRD
jgi:hypothetical protein